MSIFSWLVLQIIWLIHDNEPNIVVFFILNDWSYQDIFFTFSFSPLNLFYEQFLK